MSKKSHLRLRISYINGWLCPLDYPMLLALSWELWFNCFGHLSVICGGILWWHTNLQLKSGAIYQPPKTSPSHTPGWKVLCKPEEVCFLYKLGYLSWICGFIRGNFWAVTTRTIRKVRSFQELDTFFRQFIRNFSFIIAPITDSLKNEKFQWSSTATKTFKKVKNVDDWSSCHASIRFFKGVWSNMRRIGLAIGGVLRGKSYRCLFQWEIKWHSTTILHIW